MRRGMFLLLMLLGSFFIFARQWALAEGCVTSSGWSSIKINEIYYKSSTDWAELFNTADACVNLGGLIMRDSTATNHVDLEGEIPGAGWLQVPFSNRLNNSGGDSVRLLDNNDTAFDYLNYTDEASMCEECSWARNPDGMGGWAVTASMTPGFANIITMPGSGSDTETTTPTTTPEEPGIATSSIWTQIKINEVVSDPQEGNEWVELYNPTTSILDLAGGFICDSREITSTCKDISGVIAGNGWLKIEVGSGYLNNDGDNVILKNLEEVIVDRIDYSGGLLSGKGQSLARKADGVDTDTNVDWAITTSLTPGAANVITAPVVVSSGGGGGGGSSSPALVVAPTPAYSSSSVVINELYPNPAEDEEEFIELKNLSGASINLAVWKIGDKVKNYTLSGTIAAGEKKYFEKNVTGIALNNTTVEEVKLLGPQGEVFGIVNYDKAPVGLSFSRDNTGVWKWTSTITKGEENIFTTLEASGELENAVEDVGLVWRVKHDSVIREGVTTTFVASRTLDPRGGRVNMTWNFGTSIVIGNKVSYVFGTTGLREITINATSTAGTIDIKKIKIKVYPADQVLGSGVVISEIAPNLEEEDEYIKLQNIGQGQANLSNWKIIANEKVYKIPTSTWLAAQDYLTFPKEITKFALTNTGGLVELRMADDVLADSETYGKAAAGDRYVWSSQGLTLVKNTLEGKVAGVKISSAKKVVSKSKVVAPAVSAKIVDARDMEVGRRVVTKGRVAVLPGIYGTQFFYIFDGEAGIQIYQYKKDFPVLHEGDLVQVVGEIGVTSNQKRIKLKKRADIKNLGAGQVTSTEFLVEELAEENEGSLVKVRGEITEIKTSYMFLDNGNDEVKVYFKKNAKIDKSQFKEGDMAEVQGVYEAYKTETQLWPRRQEDIVVLGKSEDQLKQEEVVNKDSNTTSSKKYLLATIGGLGAILLAIGIKFKVQILAKLAEVLKK